MPHALPDPLGAHSWKTAPSGSRPQGLAADPGGPGQLTLQEATAQLERQLLLDDLPLATGSWTPQRPRRLPWIALALVGAAAAALGLLLHLEQRKGWETSLSSLRGEMEARGREAALRQESLERARRDQETQLNERRTEAQSLFQITERTLAELKSSLEEVRALRQDNKQLELDLQRLRQSQSAPRSAWGVRLPAWMQSALEASAPTETEAE